MAGCLDFPQDCLRLWASVIMSAIDDLSCPNDVIRDQARRWLFSSSIQIASFLWCCDRLDLDPDAARQRIDHGAVQARASVRARYAALRARES